MEFQIEDRIISDDNYFGTVRYKGSVEGFEGLWYGIEWDSSSRGKHRGNFKGKQYFDCQYSDSSASFMKIEKLQQNRKTFMQALKQKFSEAIGDYNDLYVLSNLNNKVQIEMVGMDKVRERQQHLQNHLEMPADNLLIYDIDPQPLIIESMGNNLQELNISNNLLNNWSHVSNLIVQLPILYKLSLNGNRLKLNSTELVEISNCSIKYLVLMEMKLQWYEIITLCKKLFRVVENLKLGKNHLSTIPMTENINDIFPHLKQLDLSFNGIRNLESIVQLGSLSQLQELNLNNNDIDLMELNSTQYPLSQLTNKLSIFSHVEILYLSNNQINNWKEIEYLDHFCNLKELSFRDNPIIDSLLNQTDEQTDTMILNRLNVIPRISSLLKLNLTNITEKERKNSEGSFIYEYYNPNDPSLNSKKINSLVAQYGVPYSCKIKLINDKNNNIES
ncbi:tubulin binding cofactor E [Tieghemostelium lacteum]|uniref:Tubulin binding cofactor E n=1 Tax=Tieghemostelium lacteum TaxID=361077 RepID=A0A152A5R6_TIELA|nr:tubulin binding cofactor E [Tieghemostelium lacteum]|eukprot:KYR01455.1 tubulin binding cofactor E [Tieghemostelium lacteum]